jgi:hypothetical protein
MAPLMKARNTVALVAGSSVSIVILIANANPPAENRKVRPDPFVKLAESGVAARQADVYFVLDGPSFALIFRVA